MSSMAGEGDGRGRQRFAVDWSDLAPRIASALVLVAGALATAYYGRLLFAAFWGAAAAVVVFEWLRLVSPPHLALRAGVQIAALLVLAWLAAAASWPIALAVLAAAIVVALLLGDAESRIWDGAGVFYASALVLAPVALRQSPSLGLVAIVWLFAIVWTADICAYFVGKTLGGPKLWPRISPKKTWSGLIGGAVCGVIAGLATLLVAGVSVTWGAPVIALLIAFSSQCGDLFESHMKRHFGVKDTGHIIPGHGGLMDRLDGFVVAAAVALAIGLIRQPGNVAHGILIW
jgi:phosphatidate cytidylyltransferase